MKPAALFATCFGMPVATGPAKAPFVGQSRRVSPDVLNGSTRMHKFLPLLVLAMFLSLLGCASGDSIVKVFEDPAFEGGPFSHVLVIGVHKDIRLRRRFEDALVTEISRAGSTATASLSVMEAASAIDRDAAIAAVRRTGADAVLITRVLSSEVSVTETEGRSTTAAQRRNDVPLADFFRYDYVTYTDPMTYSSVQTVMLSTDLYNVADEMRIWSVESSSFEKETTNDIINSAGRSITTQLRRDGLIE
jgi:hypothetical protein